MGKRNRERIKQILRGEEKSITSQVLDNPVARRTVAFASRGVVIKELNKATIGEQIEVLSSISPSKVGKAIMAKAPAEMDKAIRDFQKKGKPITVAALSEEARKTPSFVALCEQTGLPMSWSDELARKQMAKHGIIEG